MSNDTTLNSMIGGDVVRDFDDGTRKWPVGFIAYGDVTGVPIAAPTVVGVSHPLPIALYDSAAVAITLGQKAMTASVPVVIASDQSIINVAAPNQEVGLAAGSAPSKMTVIGAQFNTTAPSLANGQTVAAQCNAKGAILVDSTGVRPVYAVGGFVAVPSSSPSDIITLYGANGKVIRILYVEVQAVSNNTIYSAANIQLIKRSTANSGGTFTNPPKVSCDSNNPAASATATFYSASPTTLGTSVGIVKATQIGVGENTPVADIRPGLFVYDGTKAGFQPITLRSASEGIAINDTLVPLINKYLAVTIFWSEDSF